MLLFSKRATTAVTVFACLGAAKAAWHLPGATVAQVSALHLEHAALFHVYRRVIHQDVANQAIVLDDIIALAVTAIDNLNATMQSIVAVDSNPATPVYTPSSRGNRNVNPNATEILAGLQVVTANATYVMLNVVNAE